MSIVSFLLAQKSRETSHGAPPYQTVRAILRHTAYQHVTLWSSNLHPPKRKKPGEHQEYILKFVGLTINLFSVEYETVSLLPVR